MAGCFIIALGLAWLGFARTYSETLVAAGVLGFGGGILDMVLSPIVCAIQPEQRTESLNWLHSFVCVGAAFTALIAMLAFGSGMNWRALAFWMMLAPVAIGVLFLFVRLPSLVAESGNRSKVRHLVHQKFFLLTLATILLGGATEAGLVQWLPSFAELDLGFGRVAGGGSLLAFSIAMAVGRMVVGLLKYRYSVYQIMGFGCAATAILLLLAGLCPVHEIALTAAILAGLTGSCLWPSTLAVAADRYPLGGASMFGLLAALGNFGGIIMPWFIGVVADRSSIAAGLTASALCPLLMLATLRAMRRQKARFVPTPLGPVAVL